MQLHIKRDRKKLQRQSRKEDTKEMNKLSVHKKDIDSTRVEKKTVRDTDIKVAYDRDNNSAQQDGKTGRLYTGHWNRIRRQ